MARQYARVELFYDNVWNDHTSSTRNRDPIQITRGRGDEQGEPTPSVCTLTFDNRNGTFNPRNPSSSLYRKIGRNTPLRVSVGTVATQEDQFQRTVSNGWTGGSFTWTLSGGTVPDDYDIDGNAATQTHPSTNVLHYSTMDSGSSDHRIRTQFAWSAGDLTGAGAEVWLLGRGQDASNHYLLGIAYSVGEGVTAQFSKRIGGVGSVIGSAVTIPAGLEGGFANVELEAEFYVEGNRLFGKVWRWDQDHPMEWSLTAEVDPDELPTGTLTGLASRRGTGNTNANLACRFHYFTVMPGTIRFSGEVASWKPRRAIKGDAWTEVTATGILRRLGQGARPLRSAVWRENLAGNPLAFWPMNDGENATQAASALPAGTPASIEADGQFGPRQVNAWVEPLMTPAADVALFIKGLVVQDPADTQWSGDFVFAFDADAEFADVACEWSGPGAGTPVDTQVYWLLTLLDDSPGVLAYELSVVQFSGTSSSQTVLTSGTTPLMDGRVHHARVTTANSGANTDWELFLDGTSFASGTTAQPWDPVYYAGIEIAAGSTGQVSAGQMAVWDTDSPPANAANAAVVGRSGELAGARFVRLCTEEGVAYQIIGETAGADTPAMGPQKLVTLLENLLDVEDVDMGQLFDTRHQLGLTYRYRVNLYESNNPVRLALDLDDEGVAAPLEPDIDDLGVVNDVTVSRPNGSSARSVQETGPLNVQDPTADPDAVGVYDVQEEVNVDLDSQLQGVADWRRHRGTIDETRYPQVIVDLDAAPSLEAAASAMDVGDGLTLDNLSDEPDVSGQLALGSTETIDTHRRVIAFNATPSNLYGVGVYNDSGSRYDDAYSTTAAQITTGTSTSLSVAIETSRSLWVTGSGSPQFPLEIDLLGARVSVTAISGTSSPQTFTISATVVNGVNKVIPSGTSVRLWDPKRYGL